MPNSNDPNLDHHFMDKALDQAHLALAANEIPIGAIVVCQNQVIGRGHNLTERLNDVTAHAEILALSAAATYLGSKYLSACTLYVTIEPCLMCAGALRWAQLGRLVFGAYDPKEGYTSHKILHPKTQIIGGVHASSCSDLLKAFFKNKR